MAVERRDKMRPDQIYELETQRRSFSLPHKLRPVYRYIREEWYRYWLEGTFWLRKHQNVDKKDIDYAHYELIDQQKLLLMNRLDSYNVYFESSTLVTMH